MPTKSISMMHIAVGFLSIVLFCKALKFIIHQTKNHNKNDSIRQLRVELEALKVEVDGLKRILEASTKTTEQWRFYLPQPVMWRWKARRSVAAMVSQFRWTRRRAMNL